MNSKANILLIGAALLALGACNKAGTLAGNASSGTDASSSVDAGDQNAGKKLDTYVEAHNVFVGTFGFEEEAENYRKADIAHASIDGHFFGVDSGWIDQGLTKLKAARAMSGGSADLDAAADTLIGSMGKVQAHLADLKTYYESKKYLDDKLARGKAENPKMLAELDAAEKDLNRFSAVLDTAIDQRDQVVLDKLKSSNPLKYETKLALIHAKKLMTLFNGPDDVKKPEVFAKGDAEVAIIEKAIADAHQEAAKAGKTDPSGLSSLTTMIGSYRSLKQGHDIDDLKSMIEEYNQAVDSANTFGNLE
jgi:hypothetical protein